MDLHDLKPLAVSDDAHLNAANLYKYDITPYRVYSVLRRQLGECLRPSHQDTKVQWQYWFTANGAIFYVYDYKLGDWSVRICASDWTPLPPAEEKERANAFAEMIRRESKQMSKMIGKLSKSTVGLNIFNPFLYYYQCADRLLDQLDDNDTGITHFAIFLLYLASAEGFVNLLYEVFLDQVYSDSRIVSKLAREQIDLKIRLCPCYCREFTVKQIDPDDDRFKKFHAIVNRRNDYVHANVAGPMRWPVFDQDGIRFLGEVDSLDANGWPYAAANLTSENLQAAKAAVLGLIDLVRESMTNLGCDKLDELLWIQYIEIDRDGDEWYPREGYF